MHILLRGVVRGRTVELDRDPGLEENRVVDVILRTKQLPGPPLAGKHRNRGRNAGGHLDP